MKDAYRSEWTYETRSSERVGAANAGRAERAIAARVNERERRMIVSRQKSVN